MFAALLAVGLALSASRSREVTDLGDLRRYAYTVAGESYSFEVPVASVARDLELSGAHPVDALVKARAEAVMGWANARPASERATVDISVEVTGAKLRYQVSSTAGEGTADRALETAQAVSLQARTKFLEEHGYEDANGLIRPAHARLAGQYATLVAPIALGLSKPLEDVRDFAARSLAFVQTIPYEKRDDDGDTYRRPLAVLDGDRGDCDSKAVLYLAMMKSSFPEVSLALFYVTGHVYVGLEIDGEGTRVQVSGRSYLVAEPAGPGLLDLGELDVRNEGLKINDARIVP